MNEVEQKKILVGRIIYHLNSVPAGAANELLQQPLADLEVMLAKLADTREQEQFEEEALARVREAQAERASDGAWGAALVRVSLNGKHLADTESNRRMLESLLNPGEAPTPAIYSTLALQFPTKFSWESRKAKQTKEEQRAAFDAFVRENNLSSVDANLSLFQQGASVEHFAGASGIERAQYANEAAQARQKFLIHSASPSELRAEAKYQSATERQIAIKAEADRQHQFVSQQQQGLYSPLPTHNQAGELMDAKYFRRLSTLDFAAFKVAVKKWGTAQITERLRTPTPVA